MPWAKIDDDAPSHPKMFRAGLEAFGLWVAGNCYCNHRLTDGFIASDDLALLFPGTHLQRLRRCADKLVEARLWEIVDGGWQVHDFHEYNASADQVKAERQAAKERKDRWRERRGNAVPRRGGTPQERRSGEDGNAKGTRSERRSGGTLERQRNDAPARASTDPILLPPSPHAVGVPETCPRGRGERGLEHPAHPECVIVTPDSVPCYPSAALRAAWLHVEDGCPRTAHLDRFPPDLRRQCPAHRESP